MLDARELIHTMRQDYHRLRRTHGLKLVGVEVSFKQFNSLHEHGRLAYRASLPPEANNPPWQGGELKFFGLPVYANAVMDETSKPQFLVEVIEDDVDTSSCLDWRPKKPEKI